MLTEILLLTLAAVLIGLHVWARLTQDKKIEDMGEDEARVAREILKEEYQAKLLRKIQRLRDKREKLDRELRMLEAQQRRVVRY